MLTKEENYGAIEILFFLNRFNVSHANLEEINLHLKNHRYYFTDTVLTKILNGLIHDGFVESFYPIKKAEKTPDNLYYYTTDKGKEKYKELAARLKQAIDKKRSRKKRRGS